jgi:hypothetical protein
MHCLPFPNTKIMNPIEAFKDLPADVEGVAEFSRQIIDSLNNGDIEPLKFKVFLKGLETFMDNIAPTLDQLARDEAERYGEKSFTLMGAKVELREAGVKYDYLLCNYPAYSRAVERVQSATAEKKAAEKLLQSIKSETTIVDDVTGEVVTVYPPQKSSKSAVAITYPKGGSNE